MAGYLLARANLLEDCWAEIKASKGYRWLMLLSSLAFLLLKLAPETANRVAGVPWVGLFSFRTWLIIFLVLAFVAFVDAATRLLQKQAKKSLRPQLVGAAFDFDIEPYDKPDSDAVTEMRRSGRPVVFSNQDMRGSHVYLGVDFINDGNAETVLRKFRLQIVTDRGHYTSEDAEDDEIVQKVQGQSRNDAKRFYNLNTYVTEMKSVPLGKLNHGHLHFIVSGLIIPPEACESFILISVRVIAVDQWGDSHIFDLKPNRNTRPKPSEKLRYDSSIYP